METTTQNIQEAKTTLPETETANIEATKVVKCLNCDTEFEGNFCPKCGQTADAGRFTMKFIYENLLSAFISKDGGIWFTLKNMFTRPSDMIVEILKGKRKRYFSPFPMLFFVLTVYILLFSLTGSNNDMKTMEKEYLEKENTVSTELDEKTTMAISSTQELNRLFGTAIKFYNNHYTAVTMLTIPLFLLTARACYGKTNRKRYYKAEYLVAITYSMVLVVIYRCLISLVYLFSGNTSDTLSSFIPIVFVAAFTACFQKMLGFSISKTAWRSILVVVLYYILIAVLIVSISFVLMLFIIYFKTH